MKTYRITAPIVVGFIVNDEQVDMVVESGVIADDGRGTLWLIQGEQRRATEMWAGSTKAWLADGAIEAIP